MRKIIMIFNILVIAILVIAITLLLINNREKSEIGNALDKIVVLNPNAVMEHDEHFTLVLENGDMVEFSKDVSLSDADVVMVINVAGLSEGVVNIDKVAPCPAPGRSLANGKFCYVPVEILIEDEPHLAEIYPKGVLIKPFNVG